MNHTLADHFDTMLERFNKYRTAPLNFLQMHQIEAALWLLKCPDEIKQIKVVSCEVLNVGLSFTKLHDKLCKYTHIESPYFTLFKIQVELLALEEKSADGQC